MKRNVLMIGLLVLTLGIASCHSTGSNGTATEQAEQPSAQIAPKYAKGFSVKYEGNMSLVDMTDPENGEALAYHYALVPRGQEAQIPEGYTRIDTPVRSAVCMTSLQLSNFIKLGQLDKVVGITSTKHLFNKDVKAKLESGEIQKIGIEGNFDNEVIMAINPDLILISPFKRGGYDALKDVDIPLIPHLGYKEITPLGQAEWIKFIGLLIGQEEQANEMFAGIEQRYNDLCAKVKDIQERPTVFSGEMHGGNWYAVGGKSFLAQIFKDAGGHYILEEDESTGGMNLDYEVLYEKAANAQYWRILNSHKGTFTYDALKESDSRYADFDAYKNHGVIYCNMSTTPFYESMPVEPEVILADFIKVFHPEILPDYQPVYYSILN